MLPAVVRTMAHMGFGLASSERLPGSRPIPRRDVDARYHAARWSNNARMIIRSLALIKVAKRPEASDRRSAKERTRQGSNLRPSV